MHIKPYAYLFETSTKATRIAFKSIPRRLIYPGVYTTAHVVCMVVHRLQSALEDSYASLESRVHHSSADTCVRAHLRIHNAWCRSAGALACIGSTIRLTFAVPSPHVSPACTVYHWVGQWQPYTHVHTYMHVHTARTRVRCRSEVLACREHNSSNLRCSEPTREP